MLCACVHGDRRNEFQADRYAASLGYSRVMQSALCRISLENLSTLLPDRLFSLFYFSHHHWLNGSRR